MSITDQLIDQLLQGHNSPEDCVVQLEKVEDYTKHLFPKEFELVKKAHRARRFEFSTGRYVARSLLAKMGFSPNPILRDESGCPVWPEGIIGSITHKNTVCLVVLSRSSCYRSLGADIEIVEALDQSVWKVFTTKSELRELTGKCISEAEAINIVFSVKEALYKCAYPLFGDSTSTFVDEKISYTYIKSGQLEAVCLYNSMIFKAIISFGPQMIITIAYV